MANSKSTKGAGGKPTNETFDGEPNPDSSGGADVTPMVMFAATVRVSGPDYVVEANESGPVPTKYANTHVAEGSGSIIGEEMNND